MHRFSFEVVDLVLFIYNILNAHVNSAFYIIKKDSKNNLFQRVIYFFTKLGCNDFYNESIIFDKFSF